MLSVPRRWAIAANLALMTTCAVMCAACAGAGGGGGGGGGIIEPTNDGGALLSDATTPTDANGAASFDAGSPGSDDSNSADANTNVGIHGPPYPIVLVHGFFGFEKFAGLNFATYFYKVADALAQDGEKHVFTPAVDPFNSSTKRGEQLIVHIEKILAQTGHRKVNIIGHSQGGLDGRVAAHLRPDLVASVTSYAAPHGGTPIADIAMKLVQNENQQKLLDALTKLIGGPLYRADGKESSVVAGIKQFTQPVVKAFNATYTDRPTVKYYSVTGRTDMHFGGKHCKPDIAVDFITKHNKVLDPVGPLLAVQEALIDGGLLDPFPNDGLVRVKDARWGTFLGCVPADHLDEVGHLLGDLPGLLNPWRHRKFFRELVKWLRKQGL